MSYTRHGLTAAAQSISPLTGLPHLSWSSPTSTSAMPSANYAIYVPVVVPAPVLVRRLWYSNGSTATGNYDIGLYDAAGGAILTRGTTAKSGSSGEVIWDCTDTPISQGLYYLAIASSNNSDTFYRFGTTAPIPAALGVLGESVFPLPSTATFALNQTLDFIPIVGMLMETVSA